MRDQTKDLKMGQNSTHEKKKSKSGRRKQASKDGTQVAEDNADGNFVEVLDSDGENSQSVKEEHEDTQVSIKYKLGPLLGDTSSEEDAGKHEKECQEPSSDDDYDQPEGIEDISESKKKKAAQNWRRISSKLRSSSLQEDEENDPDAEEKDKTLQSEQNNDSPISEDDYDQPEGIEGISESEKKAMQNWRRLSSKLRSSSLQEDEENDPDAAREDKTLQNEQNSDSSIPDGEQTRAIENWTKLVSNVMDKRINNEILLRAAMIEHISNAEVNGSESGSESERFSRAMESWRRILLKVLEMVNEGEEINFKKVAEQVKMAESKEDRALNNWKRITGKLLKRSRRDTITDIIQSSARESSGGTEHDAESEGKTAERAIKNWEKLAHGLIQQNTEDDVRKIIRASLNHSTSNDADDLSSIVEITDVDETSREIDVSSIFEANETTNEVSAAGGEASTDSSIVSETGNEKSIKNWELVVSKVMKKAKVNFINELLGSGLVETRASVQGVDEDSEDEISAYLPKWERLVSGILKTERMREIKTVIARAKEVGHESSEGESGASKTRSRRGSTIRLKAKQHWRSITQKLIRRSKETAFSQVIKEKLRTVQGEGINSSDTENGIRAVRNWEKIVSKMIKNLQLQDIFRLKEKQTEANEELQSLPSTESDVSKWLTDNEKQLRAMKNWKNLSSKLKTISKAGQDVNDNDQERICPSCKCEYDCPILLSCAHTFCRDCVSRLIDDGEGQWFECPTCGAKIKLSDNDEELFCPNFIFLREMQRRKSGDDGCRYCGRDKKAEFVCEQCADKYCKSCVPKHTKQEVFATHNLLELQSAENTDKLRKKYYCLKHTKEELSRYCLTCEVSLCAKCARKKHKGSKHDCGSVEDAAKAGREIVEDAARMLEGEIDFDQDLENVDKMQNGLDVELDAIRNEIKSSVQNLIKQLRERETQLYNEVERKYGIIHDALSKRRADIELAARQTESFRAMLSDLQQHENDVEMLQMQATVSERMRDIIELKREHGLYIDYDFVFHPDETDVESTIDNYGFVSVQDRESKSVIIIDGEDGKEHEMGPGMEEDAFVTEEQRMKKDAFVTEGPGMEEDAFMTEGPGMKKDAFVTEGPGMKEDAFVTEHGNNNVASEDDAYEQPQETWSPTVQKREDHKPKTESKRRDKHVSESDDETKNAHHHAVRGKKVKHKRTAQKAHGEDLLKSPVKRALNIDYQTNQEELKPQVYEFEGLREPAYEGFTQLTSERGEQVNILKYSVRNYKNESCALEVKMVCPDQSIVSAHVAENADGAFTVYFCPNIKSDFNCFITIGGKCFKKDYKLLNFYGDFKGMKSKEIDLACRALSLLRWHITPGLMENKRGKIKRSRKFMKIIGTQK